MPLIINLSAPEYYGTSELRSTELTHQAIALWSMQRQYLLDPYRKRYQNTTPYWGSRCYDKTLLLEPSISIFNTSLSSEDTFIHLRRPDTDEEAAWQELLEVLALRSISNAVIVTVAQADSEPGNQGAPSFQQSANLTSDITTVYPPDEGTVRGYTQNPDSFLAPIEWYLTHKVRAAVSYLTLYITDTGTSYATTDFYQDRLKEIRKFAPFRTTQLPAYNSL